MPGPWRATAAAGSLAVTLVLAAACASRGGSPALAGGGAPLSPRQALAAAAAQANRVNSAVETISVQDSGASTSTMTGTFRYQLKPDLESSADLHTDMFGPATQLRAIATSDAVYFHMASPPAWADPGTAGSKPWVKIDLSVLPGSGLSGFAQLVQATQSGDVTTQTQLFAAAENVRAAGTQLIDGVQTTEYDGSFRAADAFKALPAGARKAVAPELHELGTGLVHFREWIDGQHQVRKIIEVHTVEGTTTTSTVHITAFDQPVHIAIPPASQTVTEFIL